MLLPTPPACRALLCSQPHSVDLTELHVGRAASRHWAQKEPSVGFLGPGWGLFYV